MSGSSEHTSFSQVKRYERCPKSFELHYRRRLPALPSEPATFGRVVHGTCEGLLLAIAGRPAGRLSEDRALDIYEDEWRKAGLTGVSLFEDGLRLVKDFIEDQGVVDPAKILSLEGRFRLPLGRFTVVGVIDRVDKVDDETIEIIDYKTNLQLFTREELDNDIQLSLYRAAARELWPWARKVKLTYWMLRHRVRLPLQRTDDQVTAALAYVQTMAEQASADRVFPAKTGAHCGYCDHRQDCGAYAAALNGKRDFVSADLADLTAVAAEREKVAGLARLLEARKRELEGVLKVHLKTKPELALAGMRYRLLRTTSSTTYPLEPTLRVLGATGLGRDELLDRVAIVDREALEGLLKDAATTMPRRRLTILRAELEATAERTYSPRLQSTPVKSEIDAVS